MSERALGFAGIPVSSPRRPPLALLAVSAGVALMVLAPLAQTLVSALRVGSQRAAILLFRPLVGELLLNTLALTAVATAASVLIGTTLAWVVERTDLPARQLWGALTAMPLAIPAFITSYAWLSISPALQGFAGAALVQTSAYYPLVYLPVAAALRGLDPTLEETSRSLGHRPWRCFRRVVLPQLRPALLGGMLLIVLHTFTEFGAFALLRYRTFTTEIFAEYQASFDSSGAALLSFGLILLCFGTLSGEYWLRGGARYARLGRLTRRAPLCYALRGKKLVVLGGLSLLVLLSIGVPVGTVLYWLTRHGSAATTPAEASFASLTTATFSSLGFALAAAVLAVFLAFPVAFLAVRCPGPLVSLIERSAYLAQGMPGIVIALALVSLTVHALHPLYQTVALLVVAYGILFLPLALVSVRAALAQAQPALEETARSLGLGPGAVLLRVILPLARPGIGAAATLVFIAVVTELTTTLLLAPIGTETLAMRVWADTSTLAFAAAAPYAALMLLISLASTWLLAGRFGRLAPPLK